MTPVEKPLLIYDGDCRFCRHMVDRWRGQTGEAVDYVPSQDVAGRFPQIPPERFDTSVQLILPSGEIVEGAEAVFRTLAFAPGRGWPLFLYRRVPGAVPVCEGVYAWVSRNRDRVSRWTRRWWEARPPAGSYFLTRRLFLRCLGLIYAVAFASLGVQITGLLGENGVWPAALFLEQVHNQTDAWRYLEFPTVFWMGAGDPALQAVCLLGAGLGLFALLGVGSVWVFFLLWVLYLSLVTVGGTFLMFQWDSLLLETGFLAIFLCPFRLRFSTEQEPRPSMAAIWLLRWLLFRLMFLSGIVKLASGDAAWHNLEALFYHYETQPLPTWIGWYAHQLPGWFQKLSTVLMFGIELIVPFFIFSSRRARLWVFFIFTGFQALIFLTGNYCFFNLLSMALGLTLLDDRSLALVWPGPGWKTENRTPRPEPGFKRWALAGVVAVVVLFSGIYFARLTVERFTLPEPVDWLTRRLEPLRLFNPYGLFAVMTKTRPEIIIEGSDDGRTWKAYGFKWKPGEVTRPPGFVAPHQPRLDWQMWFAALSSYQQNPWFIHFMVRLLQGSPDVLALLAHNPFPDRPPKYLRALVYDYRFTDRATRAATGAWWRRELKGRYAPYIKLPQTDWPAGGFAS